MHWRREGRYERTKVGSEKPKEKGREKEERLVRRKVGGERGRKELVREKKGQEF